MAENQDNQTPGRVSESTPTENVSAQAPLVPTTPAAWQWDASVPEGIRTKFSDPNKLVKSYQHLESSLGSRVAIPGETASDEERAAFFNRLGRPDSADGYDAYEAPEDMSWDKAGEKRFQEAAHAAGLNKVQAKALLDYYVQETATGLQNTAAEYKARQDESLTVLRKQWGPNFQKNVALAQQTVVSLGDKDLAQALDATGMGDHPAMLRFLARVGEGLVEDGILKPEFLGRTKEDSQAEANKLMASEAYYSQEHPDHKTTIARVRDLYQVLYPTT